MLRKNRPKASNYEMAICQKDTKEVEFVVDRRTGGILSEMNEDHIRKWNSTAKKIVKVLHFP